MMDLQTGWCPAASFPIIGWTQEHLWLECWNSQVPSSSEAALNVSEQAEDWGIRAYELPGSKGRGQRVNKALRLDPRTAIRAYEFLMEPRKNAGKGGVVERPRHCREKIWWQVAWRRFTGGSLEGFTGPLAFLCAAMPKLSELHSLHYWQGKESVAILGRKWWSQIRPNDNQNSEINFYLFWSKLGKW